MAILDKMPRQEIIGTFAGTIDFYMYMGKIPVARTWPDRKAPRTKNELEAQQKFATAVHNWQTMSEAQRNFWRTRSYSTHMTGYEFYISRYMLTT